jgi:LDH2 family malate/lactate/ureidoglycolate dehydrogenase
MQMRSADELRRLMREMLEAVGTPAEAAKFVGESLVDANLAGHDSHGVIRILLYLAMARCGEVDPTAEPALLGTDGATARVDGKWGWGQLSMRLATDTAIELARQNGLGAAAVVRSYHIGRVAPYVEQIARAGMIGLATSNAGRAVAPYGSKDRVMGTNPIAWAVPRADGKAPICLDIATSSVAEGKLRVAQAKGEAIAPGLILNSEGRPSIDPNDFYTGGMLVPFGAHKGSGFSMLAQLIGVGLAEATPDVLSVKRGGNGPFVLAIDVARFRPLEAFLGAVEDQVHEVNEAQATDGFDRVQMPGEPEVENRARRVTEGIPVPDRTWDELIAMAQELGVTVPAG